jgi:hypothetical protein
MTDIDFTLLEKTVAESRDESRETRKVLIAAIDKMAFEMKEGFAIMRNHAYTQHQEIEGLERRLTDVEHQLERLSRAQGINADDS